MTTYSRITPHTRLPLVIRITGIDVMPTQDLDDMGVDFNTLTAAEEAYEPETPEAEPVEVGPLAGKVFARFCQTDEGVKYAHAEFQLSMADVIEATKAARGNPILFRIPKGTEMVAVVEPEDGGVKRYSEKDKETEGDLLGYLEVTQDTGLPVILDHFRSYVRDFIPETVTVVLRKAKEGGNAKSDWYGLLIA